MPGVTIIDTIGNFLDRRWTVSNEDYHKTPLRSRTLFNQCLYRGSGILQSLEAASLLALLHGVLSYTGRVQLVVLAAHQAEAALD